MTKKLTSKTHFARSQVFFTQGEYQKTIEELQKVIELEPKSHEAWEVMGVAYVHLNNYSEAIKCFYKSLYDNFTRFINDF